jgi:hypothetical protein
VEGSDEGTVVCLSNNKWIQAFTKFSIALRLLLHTRESQPGDAAKKPETELFTSDMDWAEYFDQDMVPPEHWDTENVIWLDSSDGGIC